MGTWAEYFDEILQHDLEWKMISDSDLHKLYEEDIKNNER